MISLGADLSERRTAAVLTACLLETSGRLLLVDVGDTGAKVELGDRVTVTGRTDNDKDEAEAPELDAGSVTDWLPPSP